MTAKNGRPEAEALARDSIDCQLYLRARAGDDDGYRALSARCSPIVMFYARRVYSNDAEQYDFAAEVWMRALVNKPFEPGHASAASFRTWLRRVAKNVACDRLKQSGRDALVTSLDASYDEGSEHCEPAAARECEPERALASKQLTQEVRRAVERLEPDYREVVELHYFRGLSYEEIAAALGVSLATVKARLFRARKQLRVKVEGMGYGYED